MKSFITAVTAAALAAVPVSSAPIKESEYFTMHSM